jgi:hypothetical protein
MYCNSCGKELADGSKFCPTCGEAATAQAAVPQPVVVAGLEEQLAGQPFWVQLTLKPFIKLDGFLKTKVFTDKKRTAIIIGSYIGALVLTGLIPPLRGIGSLLWDLLWIAVVLYSIIIMLRLYSATPDRIRDAAGAYPKLYGLFGLTDTPIAPLLADNLVVRFLWRTLPKELRDTEPVIEVAPDFVLRCEAGTVGLLAGKKAKQLWGCTAMEYGTMYQTVLQAVEVMSRQLGATSARTYQPLMKYIGRPMKVIQRGSKSLWQGSIGDPQPSEQKFAALLENHLKTICGAMGLNYDDYTLGNYDPGSSTWYGWGSWGMVGLAAGLSIASAMKRSAKKAQFKTACVYAAFNNIAAKFNEQYFPAEFEAWKAEQL